jgi:hypothetical protein
VFRTMTTRSAPQGRTAKYNERPLKGSFAYLSGIYQKSEYDLRDGRRPRVAEHWANPRTSYLGVIARCPYPAESLIPVMPATKVATP